MGNMVFHRRQQLDNNKVEDLGCTPTGCHLFRKRNDAGGWTYFSDEISGGIPIWDTSLVSESTLLTAILCEQHRRHLEFMINNGWKSKNASPDIKDDRMAMNGGLFLDPVDNGSIDSYIIGGSGVMKIDGDIPVSGEY